MSGQDKKKFRILKLIGIVLLVLLAAIIALPFVLDVNQFRPELESKLSSALGREVRVGKLKLSLLSGSVSVEEISIADNPSFSRSPFVNAKLLKVGIELKPLIFSKSIRITGIALDHPSITLIRSISGQWNFSDLGSGSEPKTAGSGQSGSFSGKDVSIQQLKILGGQVTIVNGQERRKPSVYNNVDIEASNLSYTAAFPFRLTVSMPGQGTLTLEGNAGPLNKQDMLMTPMSGDQSLDFTMQAMLKPTGTLGPLGRLVKGGALNVPFFVRGSASEPKFVPDVKKAAGGLLGSALGQDAQAGQTNEGNALGDTLRSLFKKKK